MRLDWNEEGVVHYLDPAEVAAVSGRKDGEDHVVVTLKSGAALRVDGVTPTDLWALIVDRLHGPERLADAALPAGRIPASKPALPVEAVGRQALPRPPSPPGARPEPQLRPNGARLRIGPVQTPPLPPPSDPRMRDPDAGPPSDQELER